MNFTQAERNWGTPGLQGPQSKLVTYFPTWAYRRDQALWVNVWLHWENVKEALPCSQPQRHHFWCPPSKESYQSFAVLVVGHYWKRSITGCCAHMINYKNEMPIWFGSKIWCTAALYDLLDLFMRQEVVEWIHFKSATIFMFALYNYILFSWTGMFF